MIAGNGAAEMDRAALGLSKMAPIAKAIDAMPTR
jgi:hypothetical protein